MPSLHWILGLTLTLLLCLSAAPILDHKISLRIIETIEEIEELNKTKCERNDSRFYIASDVPVECIEPMLSCAILEIDVVAEECFGDKKRNYGQKSKRTKALIQEVLNLTNSPTTPTTTEKCKKCEGHQTKSYKAFLRDLMTLIERLGNKK